MGLGNNSDFIIRSTRSAKNLMCRIMEGFEPDTGVTGLNSTHYRTLVFLYDHEGTCMKRICLHLHIEAGSFTPVADRLICEGLAERIRDERDRRRYRLSLTQAGRDFTGIIKEKISRHVERRLDVLTTEQYSRFMDALKCINEFDRLMEKSYGKE